VASTHKESKIKATVLSSLATAFHKLLKSGKSNKQDEKDRSIASLQDEVQKLNTKTEAKDDLIRCLRARNEEVAGLLDRKNYQQMHDLRNSDGWTKVYMLLSIDAFDRMDVFERAMFFETGVSRKLIARAKQYVSFGVFKPDCLAIEGAPSDDADDVEHLVARGNEGDSSSKNGQLGAEVSSTEGQADDETQSTDQQVEGEASSVEGQDSSDTFTTDVHVKDEALNTKVQVQVVPWSADAQDGNEPSRTDEERMDHGTSVPLSFSNTIGEDLLYEITGEIAAIKAQQEKDEANIKAQQAQDAADTKAQADAEAAEATKNLWRFAYVVYTRMVQAIHVLESHGAELVEKEEHRALAKKHLHIRERTIVREFVTSQNGEDVDEFEDDDESEENDEDDDEENRRDHD